jgi:lysophospholipase L1-like esterase
MKQLMQFVSVDSPMPAVFRNTTENELTDPAGSLHPFWEKLGALDRPLRIVHIGDSHVRGHVFPYVMRCSLEDDFGSKAVENIPVTYQTSGIARETGSNGVVYHILGVNGATCQSFSTPEHIRQIADLHPDLVILSFGTNEAHGRRYNASEHTAAMNYLIAELKASCPDVAFLMTTPPGAYVRNGRRGKIISPRTPLVVENELKFAREHGIAIWDMYDIVGGKQRACLNWNAAKMYQRDKIHFTHEGYTLQGLLLHEAFIKAYNHYVATRLD